MCVAYEEIGYNKLSQDIDHDRILWSMLWWLFFILMKHLESNSSVTHGSNSKLLILYKHVANSKMCFK
jgi:hypothetical protein